MKTLPKILIGLSLMGLTLMPVIGCNSSSSSDSSSSEDSTAVDSDTGDSSTASLTYPVVDTGQTACYDGDGAEITCPETGEAFAGQDAQYAGLQPSYTDNGDGTVTDNVTGLVWQQVPANSGLNNEEAEAYCESLVLGGYDDWRLPTVKELQSIVDYTRSPSAGDAANLGPAINTDFFDITALASGTTDYDPDYGYFWTSTSAYFGGDSPEYYYAWYVAFGSAVGQDGADFHGAGAVRFDTKYEGGALGEGGERYYNYVRCVRDVERGVSGNSSDDDGLAYEPFINSIVFDFAYGDTEAGMDMPIDDGSDGEEPAGTVVDTGSDMAAPELDFNARVDYLSGLGVTMTAADLEAVFKSPPPPLAEELAQTLNITEQQAETLMNDYLGLPDLDLGMSSM